MTESPALTPGQVAAQLNKSLKSVRRWMRHGVLAPDGSRVKLRAERVGGRWEVLPEWVEEFKRELNQPKAEGERAPHLLRTPAEARRAGRAAREQLRRPTAGGRT